MNVAEFKLAAEAAPRKGKRKTQAHTGLVEACMVVCNTHASVAWARVIRTGAMRIQDRFIRFGFPGCSDVIGMLEGSGQLLAVECKIWPDILSNEQEAFLQVVNASGGLGIVVYDHRELVDALDRWRLRHKP
jgi:hypothetical protein